MFFLFESPLKKKNEGFEKKKLQERIPVVFHLHNLLDSVDFDMQRLFLPGGLD